MYIILIVISNTIRTTLFENVPCMLLVLFKGPPCDTSQPIGMTHGGSTVLRITFIHGYHIPSLVLFIMMDH